MKLTIAAILAPCAPSVCFGLIGSGWRFTTAPVDGLSDITFPFKIANAPHQRGYYFAQQFNSKNVVRVGYTGLQPQVDFEGNSSFQEGTTVAHPNCRPGVNGGTGVSCSVEIIGDYSHTYNLVVENIGGTTWRGRLVDGEIDDSVVVDAWTLPEGSGKIVNGQVGFVEYFIWNGHPSYTCESTPFTEATFMNPTTTTIGASGGKVTRVYEFDRCEGKVGFSPKKVPEGYDIKVSF
ncbi:MAG: hypothetical protein J3R72DRAFT_455243 [Linnemannia gamsii]|nr:MAG: hypothetical protein J3R72DRAFT_455243 [Linnemannia gamsii]